MIFIISYFDILLLLFSLAVDHETDFTNHPELQMHLLDKEMIEAYIKEQNYNPEQDEEYDTENFMEAAKSIDWQEDMRNFVKDPKGLKCLKDFIKLNKKKPYIQGRAGKVAIATEIKVKL